MRIVGCLLVVILVVTAAWGQKDDPKIDHPNLSGTWYLDINSLPKSSRQSIKNYVLTIEHAGDEIKINRKYVENGHSNDYTETLFTDKRKEENIDTSGFAFNEGFGKTTMTSKSYWKKGAMIREFIYDKTVVRSGYLIDRQIIVLSSDSKVLTITTEFQLNTRWLASSGLPQTEQNGVLERKLTFTKAN